MLVAGGAPAPRTRASGINPPSRFPSRTLDSLESIADGPFSQSWVPSRTCGQRFNLVCSLWVYRGWACSRDPRGPVWASFGSLSLGNCAGEVLAALLSPSIVSCVAWFAPVGCPRESRPGLPPVPPSHVARGSVLPAPAPPADCATTFPTSARWHEPRGPQRNARPREPPFPGPLSGPGADGQNHVEGRKALEGTAPCPELCCEPRLGPRQTTWGGRGEISLSVMARRSTGCIVAGVKRGRSEGNPAPSQ